MNLIIAGHQRSGTTLIAWICDRHPEISLTSEFGNYLAIGQPFGAYVKRMLRRIWEIRGRSGILPRGRPPGKWLASNLFSLRYLWLMRRYRGDLIGPAAIRSVLGKLFPGVKLTGDKYPDYVYQLDDFAGFSNVKTIVIYRDARDVASSTLIKARGDWSDKPFSEKMNSASKVAARWNQAIAIMERHRHAVFALPYEELVRLPQLQLAKLAEWLDVNPDGFPTDGIRDTSIGKYHTRLSPDDLQAVLRISGSTLESLGYEI